MFTLNEITKETEGILLQGDGLKKIKRIVIDSRRVRRGDLFIAIKGPRHDGHDFVRRAVRKGAAGVLVSALTGGISARTGIIRVDDTVRALGWIARAYRRRFRIPVVAVTGSAGKTTAKELIARVLQSRFNVLKNSGTENNQFGVPLTILKLRPGHGILVLELGTNRPGDIPWLSSVAEPDVAVFTNIGASHLEQLKTPRLVFKEKMSVTGWVPSNGAVIVNRDDAFLKTVSPSRIHGRLMTYGIKNPADFHAADVRLTGAGRLRFVLNSRTPVEMKTLARHNVSNALAAAACGSFFGIEEDVIAARLRRGTGLKGRQQFRKVAGVGIIDDTYNSNPVSFKSAVTTLAHFPTRGRKILLCGDMLELGTRTKDLHARCGRVAARLKIDAILSYGFQTEHLTRAARKSRSTLEIRHFRDRQRLHDFVLRYCRRGDMILVKGSRGMRMEQTVTFLRNNLHKIKGR